MKPFRNFRADCAKLPADSRLSRAVLPKLQGSLSRYLPIGVCRWIGRGWFERYNWDFAAAFRGIVHGQHVVGRGGGEAWEKGEVAFVHVGVGDQFAEPPQSFDACDVFRG